MRSFCHSIRLYAWFALFMTSWITTAAGQDRVALIKGESGWKIQVDGNPFYVKGFTWSHCPVGMKYDYDLFQEEKPAIEAALKRDYVADSKSGWKHDPRSRAGSLDEAYP